MSRLIINADDFGITSGVNRAILECCQAGTVTSATLMANSLKFSEAVAFSKANPKLAVGAHIVLVDGEPLAGAAATPSLLAIGTDRFVAGIAAFARRALLGQLNQDEIYREAMAQFEKIASAGIRLSHFDTHKHTHMFPRVLRPLLRAARESGIRAVRNPYAPAMELRVTRFIRRPKLWTRASQLMVLRPFARQFRQQVEAAGMQTTDGTLGITATGHLDQSLFNDIISNLPDGTWEFVCHPGYCDAELGDIRTRLRASRVQELHVLTAPATLDSLRRHGVELINFGDLNV